MVPVVWLRLSQFGGRVTEQYYYSDCAGMRPREFPVLINRQLPVRYTFY